MTKLCLNNGYMGTNYCIMVNTCYIIICYSTNKIWSKNADKYWPLAFQAMIPISFK